MTANHPSYYLGNIVDSKTNLPTPEKVLLDPSNLTTHAVVTGMTGSGKTGLCIGLLEEAALHGTPAIIVDPKGDLTNLLLHFPSLAGTDFKPWIDSETAALAGKTVEQMALETSEKWKKGLSDWGLGVEQVQALGEAADFAIFTPGSTAGIPVNILSSFESPNLSWEENSESLRERISSTVTALLGLVGLSDIDPLRSKEHILLCNLIETAWTGQRSLTLTDLILQVQRPPMERLGAFPMESFYPEKERFPLAMLLNNFLASPSFQIWQQGQSLNVDEILYSKNGKPRHSVFYLAHLSENERMFFITLLFAAVETWMRTQRGSGNLRALVYFDEIMGYLPPVANPPSKTILLRLLKQARAFGVGLVLATQNPVDVDYKALSNAGTWMIGRLQTQQDKQRLLDGLTSAGGNTNTSAFDKLISGLQKREFLFHSIYKSAPLLFNTRWTLNFLAGPLTRDQIPLANSLAGAGGGERSGPQSRSEGSSKTLPTSSTTGELSTSRPAVPGEIAEYFLPADRDFAQAAAAASLPAGLSAESVAYHAALLVQAETRYLSRAYNLDYVKKITVLLEDPGSGLIDWAKKRIRALDPQQLGTQPLPKAQFHAVSAWLGDARKTQSIEKDFLDWIYRTGTLKIRSNPVLKLYASPEETAQDFSGRCQKAADQSAEIEMKKVEQTYSTRVTSLQRKVEAQQLDVKAAENAVSHRNIDEIATGGLAVLGMLTGKKRSFSSTISKVRMTSAAKDRQADEQQTLQQLQDQLQEILAAKEKMLAEIRDKWSGVAAQTSEISVNPGKGVTFAEIFGVVWLPCYRVDRDGQKLEVPAFSG
ncbi:MAG: DUF87 domain-containing protein [Chloroflexi bacterium]|nr:DUF87 domain-containing protein [Chloroflexota bacterium]